jgi:SagB-type dehydrogenase family enzyme
MVTRREIINTLAGSLLVLCDAVFLPKGGARAKEVTSHMENKGHLNLPAPMFKGRVSLETTIKNRRTIRSFTSEQLTLEQVSQLLFAAQGITEDQGFKRSVPSAGALYPLDVYAVMGTGGAVGIKEGIYHYEPKEHAVSLLYEGDFRYELARACLQQMWMRSAPLTLVVCAEYARVCSKYGARGTRYAHMEAGHIGQNIFLQAEALGLGAGIVGAFSDEDVLNIMKIPRAHEPLVLLPVGYKKR